MQAINGVLQILVLIGAFLVFGAIACLPSWLGIAAGNAQEDLIRQAELARKTAIADAAIEARKRGETFVPPADYDR